MSTNTYCPPQYTRKRHLLNKTVFDTSFQKVLAYVSSKGIVLSIVLSIVGGLLWYYALSIMKLSTAYPFTALSYIFIALFGFLLLKESINYYQLIGYTFVVVGILLITLNNNLNHNNG